MMEVPALRSDLNNSYGLNLPETATIEMLEGVLADRINTMITADFNGLVQLLYRTDVNEFVLRQFLRENPTAESGRLIAKLILERVWKKILVRREFNSATSKINNRPGPDEEEKW
jgi:hypothetical protein